MVLMWCLVDAGLVTQSWTRSWPLSLLRICRDTRSFVCSFIHLFTPTSIKDFYGTFTALKTRGENLKEDKILAREGLGSESFLMNPFRTFPGLF